MLKRRSYKWKENINKSNLCYNYRIFKEELKLDTYLSCNLPVSLCNYLCKFRLSNHKLPIQVGRYNKFICPLFTTLRCQYLPKYYYNKPNVLKFKQLFSSQNKARLVKLAIFVKHIMLPFKNDNT